VNWRDRLNDCEDRLALVEHDYSRLLSLFDEVVKNALNAINTQLTKKNNIEKDLEELKRQMALTIRAQCATYSAALERVQSMLEFEAKLKALNEQ
jgi:uncharacterized protein Yka (UPF0111/DUF47 family)